MNRTSKVLVIWLLGLGCGRSHFKEPPEASAPPVISRPADMPTHPFGAFVASEDVPDAAANGGNVVLVVPSYIDDASTVASALRANGKVAILSAHHVFGNPESTWGPEWAHTKTWAEPFKDLIAAIYVVDEPYHNGITAETQARAIARVRADGYKTMIAEWVDEALRYGRPQVDYFGTTCYDWPGPGSWALDRCEVAYNSHPEWNIVIGQGFDWHARSGTPGQQITRWAQIGKDRGVIYWVWRWPNQEGIGDNPEARAAYHKGAGW